MSTKSITSVSLPTRIGIVCQRNLDLLSGWMINCDFVEVVFALPGAWSNSRPNTVTFLKL
jgi:hypothetical protein